MRGIEHIRDIEATCGNTLVSTTKVGMRELRSFKGSLRAVHLSQRRGTPLR